jgi:hypothetical protein
VWAQPAPDRPREPRRQPRVGACDALRVLDEYLVAADWQSHDHVVIATRR